MSLAIYDVPISWLVGDPKDMMLASSDPSFPMRVHGQMYNGGDELPIIDVSIEGEHLRVSARSAVTYLALLALGRTRAWVVPSEGAESFGRDRRVERVDVHAIEDSKRAAAVEDWHLFRFEEELVEGAEHEVERAVSHFFSNLWSDPAYSVGRALFSEPVVLDRRLSADRESLDLKVWTPWRHSDAQWLRMYAVLIRSISDEIQTVRWSNAGLFRSH